MFAEFATRQCGPNGLWLDRDNVESSIGYTDYVTHCMTKETNEVYQQICGDDIDNCDFEARLGPSILLHRTIVTVGAL